MEVHSRNSSVVGDSNALIMPSGKKKRKGQHQETEAAITLKLSKSHKRKLNQLKEEKQRTSMLLESVKILDKYKIPEYAFSLLRSSKAINRGETAKEKRRMALQCSKAGLQVPHSTGHSFWGVDDHPVSDSKTESAEVPSEQDVHEGCGTELRICNESALLDLHQQIFREMKLVSDVVSVSEASVERMTDMDEQKPIIEDARICSPIIHGHHFEGSPKLTDESEGNSTSQLASSRLQATPRVVHVKRPDEVEKNRKDLPIIMMEQEIMEAINENLTVVICGETGCGKTTQVPQFLYEAGFGSTRSDGQGGIIGVTQPRRVAVRATAKRVAFELGLRLGEEVGFQVRHEKNVKWTSSIKFMTDGILLRELQTDFLLSRYSVLVLDEAHERSTNTDILVGVLSRVVQLRQKIYQGVGKAKLSSGQIVSVFPLKLILMSATMRAEDFKGLFRSPPPVVKVHSRQFKVSKHFSKRTEEVDYIGQAIKKVKAIHHRLPQGGILVFVTGQREVEYVCQKLKRELSKKLNKETMGRNRGIRSTGKLEPTHLEGISTMDTDDALGVQGSPIEDQTSDFSGDESGLSSQSESECDVEVSDDDLEVDDNSMDIPREENSPASSTAAFEALSGKPLPDCNSEALQDVSATGDGGKGSSVCVLPLYTMLPVELQFRIFKDAKEGERLIVVTTNVAETSLTIPGIKYVVDTGREKVKKYNPSNGMETYEVQWISKASAEQRAGRAGRTGPGHCYRLYTAAAFSKLSEFSCPEITKVPLYSIVLLLKSLGFGKVENFPFPTPLETTALREAERCLKTLEALESDGSLTPLGKAMACYPISPRHSRMLLTVISLMRVKEYVRPNLVLAYAVAAAAALSLSNPFLFQFGTDQSNSGGAVHDGESDDLDGERNMATKEMLRRKQRIKMAEVIREKFCNPSSDALTVANALKSFELSESRVEFCSEHLLHYKTMDDMCKLRKQLLRLVLKQSATLSSDHEFAWVHGTIEEVEQAWRAPSSKNPLWVNEEECLGEAICAGWTDRAAKSIRSNSRSSSSSEGDRKVMAHRYQACMVEESVFLDRRSSVSRSEPKLLVYNELLHTKRPYMHGATSVKPEWLVKHAKSMCSFSTVDDRMPYYDRNADDVFNWVRPTFGPHLWQLESQAVPICSKGERIKVFAWALLEGHVLQCLKSFRKEMAARPCIILKGEAAGERRVGNLLLRMKKESIDSRERLREVWKKYPEVLHEEVLGWFKKSFHSEFQHVWDKMHAQIQQQPQQHLSNKVKKDRNPKRND